MNSIFSPLRLMQDPGDNQGLISLYTLLFRELDVLKMLIITAACLRTYSFSGGGAGGAVWVGGLFSDV
jgi:hypothetical protein